ncbi:MAG: type II toxin-antitoxin system HicA family toxin [Bacteroidales bacterium]|nr:type II toxin-antitoxin system HicA family toxin [Bacteroidales bacterium]
MKKTVNEVIALLEKNGWSYKRTNGDHHILTKT